MGLTREIQIEEERFSLIDAKILECFKDMEEMGKSLRSVAKEVINGLCGCQPTSEIKNDDSLVFKSNALHHNSAKVVGTVLYVDDENINLELFQECFGEMFNIIVAHDGPEALRILRERKINVLVTDQRMPKMTGVELCKIVKDRHPNVVRVIISAYSPKAYEETCKEAQIRCFIQKPWDNNNVVKLLREAIEDDAEYATIVG